MAVQELAPEMTFEEARIFAQKAVAWTAQAHNDCLFEKEGRMSDITDQLRAENDALKERVDRSKESLHILRCCLSAQSFKAPTLTRTR